MRYFVVNYQCLKTGGVLVSTGICLVQTGEITNNECRELLDKPADVVLMNGFEDDFVPKGATFTGKRKRARSTMLRVANCLLGEDLGDDTLIIGTSGRYEFKNKGIDVFLESLNRLNRDKDLKKKVLAFVNVPSWVGDPREDLQQRLKSKDKFTEPLQCPFHHPLAAQYDARPGAGYAEIPRYGQSSRR